MHSTRLTNWYDSDVVGIDTGITMVMVENARTAFVWDTFMKNPEAQRGMERAGFKSYQPSRANNRVASNRSGSEQTHGKIVTGSVFIAIRSRLVLEAAA